METRPCKQPWTCCILALSMRSSGQQQSLAHGADTHASGNMHFEGVGNSSKHVTSHPDLGGNLNTTVTGVQAGFKESAPFRSPFCALEAAILEVLIRLCPLWTVAAARAEGGGAWIHSPLASSGASASRVSVSPFRAASLGLFTHSLYTKCMLLHGIRRIRDPEGLSEGLHP